MEITGTRAHKHKPYEISYKALQDSLKQGFIALNKFQNSGFRNKTISDIDKQISPSRLHKRKIQKLSKKSLQESTSIAQRNTAILMDKIEQKYPVPLAPIGEYEYVPSLSTNAITPTLCTNAITIPTAEPLVTSSKSSPIRPCNRSVRVTPVKLSKSSCTHVMDPIDSDDDYDEGGFTPRFLNSSSQTTFNKLPKIPDIPKESSIFVTIPDREPP